jgi:hypothetical protein
MNVHLARDSIAILLSAQRFSVKAVRMTWTCPPVNNKTKPHLKAYMDQAVDDHTLNDIWEICLV